MCIRINLFIIYFMTLIPYDRSILIIVLKKQASLLNTYYAGRHK